MTVGGAWLRTLAVVAWCALLSGVVWILPVDGDDAYAHSVMAVEQVKCWREGEIWPRFHPDWNGETGSFLPSVYAPLTLAAEGVVCSVLGEGTRTVGVVLVGSLLVGALLLAVSLRIRELDGGLAWVVAAYPLAAVMARATTTEVMALAFAGSAIVLGLPPGPRTRSQGVALAVAVALVSGCQVGMVLMIALVLAAAWLVTLRMPGPGVLWSAGWFGTGVLVGGLFWWPTVHDFSWMAREALLRGEYDWRTHNVLTVASNAELGPFVLATFVSLLAVLVVIVGERRRRGGRGPILAGMTWALFLATPLAFPVWKLLPPMAALQFPWRFLGPATVLALVGTATLDGRRRLAAVALLVLPAVLAPVELRRGTPGLTPSLDGRELARRSSVAYGLAPVLPSMPGFYAPHFNAITSLRELRRQGATVTRQSGGCGFPQVFDVKARGDSQLRLPLQWWPELVVSKGGGELAYENLDGLVGVRLPSGNHRITVSLAPSRSRRMGALISLAGLILAGILWIVWGKRGKRAHVRVTSAGDGESMDPFPR